MAWTTADLLMEVRRHAMLPSSSVSATTDEDILAQADRAMQAFMVPLLLSTQEEYLVRRLRVSLAQGVSSVEIPRRAVGARVRNVALLRGAARTQLVRLRPEELERYTNYASTTPAAFWLDGAYLNLVPAPVADSTLEVSIYVRPGRLTADTYHRKLTAVTPDTDYLGNPATGRTRLQWAAPLSTAALGSRLDVTSAQPPFESKALGAAYNSIGSNVTSVDVATSDILSTLAVGDVVSPVDESSMVQLPVELHPLLYQRTAQLLLEQLGYANEAAMAAASADRMESQARTILTPRSDGNPPKLVGGTLDAINRSVWWGRW